MPGKKEKEELTAEEYRQKAQEQIHELKDQWKIFFRTGIIILAAVNLSAGARLDSLGRLL